MRGQSNQRRTVGSGELSCNFRRKRCRILERNRAYLTTVIYSQAISALFAWIGVHGYSACGAEREVHLFGREQDLTLLAPVVIEMQLPVEKTTPTPL